VVSERTGVFDAHHPPARDLLDDCVHCGFCLPACPTYRLWGLEADSPRGRILLMDSALRGELPLDRETVSHWDACLGCMACVTACPSGVQYDRLIESTRQQVERLAPRTLRERAVRAGLFAVLPHRARARALGALAAVYHGSRLPKAARARGLLDRVPRLRDLDAVTPRLRLRTLAAGPGPRRLSPRDGRKPRLRVALLEGCVAGAWFGGVTAAAARVLAASGAEVLVPRGQGCCGALELHTGREAQALLRAQRLMGALAVAGADVIAVTSAGCGSAMKEYSRLLADDPAWAALAAAFGERVRDVSEVLADLGPPEGLKPLALRVAYHDACHLAHAQRIRGQPRAILGWIPGLEVVEIPSAEQCCGSAGVYNILQPQPAGELGRRRAAAVIDTGADVLSAGNAGCLVQITGWMRAAGREVPALHPVELLDLSRRGIEPHV
jgi:glycolate oxidase iron-sulfur subunit